MNEYKTFEELIIKYDKKVMKLESILTELEEWLNKQLEDTIKCFEYSIKNNNKTFIDMYSRDRYLYKMNIEKIQELKEKYK